MTLDDILASLFPDGHDVKNDKRRRCSARHAAIRRPGARHRRRGPDRRSASTRPFAFPAMSWTPLEQGSGPILVLVDSDSQRMSKRDELLGLNEFLAHLAKSLIYADMHGRPTIGLLYGHSAAGAFLATALATRVLVELPGADPAVMDLPSMAQGDQAVDRSPAREGEVDAGVRPGPVQSRPDGRGSRDLGRWVSAGRPVGRAARPTCRMRTTGAMRSARSVAAG